MSQEDVDRATKALWDYINSLPPDRRQLAIDYQNKLEFEATTTEGGMQAVIRKQLAHQTMLLEETVQELHEIAADHVATVAIRGIMSKPNPKE